jgi:hypothetical protein
MGSGLSREKHSSLPYSFLSDLLLTLVALELDAASLGRGGNAGIFAAVVTTIYSHAYWRVSRDGTVAVAIGVRWLVVGLAPRDTVSRPSRVSFPLPGKAFRI